jgi:hypothetical protein
MDAPQSVPTFNALTRIDVNRRTACKLVREHEFPSGPVAASPYADESQVFSPLIADFQDACLAGGPLVGGAKAVRAKRNASPSLIAKPFGVREHEPDRSRIRGRLACLLLVLTMRHEGDRAQ